MTLPAYPADLGEAPDWPADDGVERYARFERLLVAAERERVIDGLPVSESDAEGGDYARHAQPIGERLWILGYLGVRNETAARVAFVKDRERFLSAVADFQAEAGLKRDRWAGEKTWTALGQLVSFERDSLDPRWLADPDQYPVILRACQARLHALGLSRRRPGTDFRAADESGVRKLHQLLWSLRGVEVDDVAAFTSATHLTAETIALLLDHDSLLRMVSDASSSTDDGDYFAYRISSLANPGGSQRHPRADLVRRFIVKLVQVDLWLSGYPIDLFDRLDYRVFGFASPRRGSMKLNQYLRDFGKALGVRQRGWGNAITPAVIRALADAPDGADLSELRVQISHQYQTQDQIDAAISEGRALHLRVFDGIRRAMRRLIQFIGRAGKFIYDIAGNLVRVFYSELLTGFRYVKKAISIITTSLSALNGSAHSNPAGVVRINTDGDVTVSLADDGSTDALLDLIRHMHLWTERFYFATRMITLVLSALIRAGLSRWAALARSIVSNLGELVESFAHMQALEAAIERTRGNIA
ncbi:MAG: hypothetical protein O2780_14540 [Proteobacteria bacterium]|nr:hypothetical protein [Pseudomonadota bacterium]